jgi:hypothetical protein
MVLHVHCWKKFVVHQKEFVGISKKYKVASPKAVTFSDPLHEFASEVRNHGGEGVIRKGGCRRVGGWPTRQDAG